MRIWVGVGIALAAACGNDNNNPPPDGGPDDPEPVLLESHAPVKSGSRLKLMWHDIGGQRAFVGVLDSERSTACSALAFADGNTYCAPPRSATNAFKDAGCTEPLYRKDRGTNGCVPPPLYLHWTTPAATCGGASTTNGLYRAVPTTVGDYMYVRASDGSCSRSSSRNTNADFYELGEEVPPTGMVKMADTTEEVGSGRLRFNYQTAEDGTKIFVNTRDSQFEGSCLFIPNENSQALQCLANFVQPYYYADGDCARDAAAVRTGCPVPKYLASSRRECELSVVMQVRGPEISTPLFRYDYSDKTCSLTDKPAGYSFYEAGEEVAMAELQRSTRPSGSRVQAIEYVNAEIRQQSPSVSAKFYDQELKTDCDVVSVPGKGLRCFPVSQSFNPSLGNYYSDATCQAPLELAVNFYPLCEEPVVPGVVDVSSGACSSTRTVRRVGQRYSGSLYRAENGACLRETLPLEAYLLGETIPLDQLAEATLATDP